MKFNLRIVRHILLATYCGILAAAVLSCDSEPTALESKIQIFLQDNEGISCPERADLVQVIGGKPNWAKFYGKPETLDKLIRQVGAEMSGVAQDFTICSGGDSSEQPSAFDFYIENSRSMHGYFKGNREFKDAMLNLLARINGRSDQLGLYFINSEIHKIPEPLTRFFEVLEPAYANQRKFGDGRTSELNKTIDLAASEWLKDPEKISFVVSDYIYSIRSPNIAEELTDHKYYTTVAMQKLTKLGDFALMILQFQSSFDGKFFDCKNGIHDIAPKSGEMRPFYVWVFGKRDNLARFMREYRVTELKRFEHFILFQRPFKTAPFYSVLPRSFIKGTFKADRTGERFTGLSDIKPPNRDSMVQWAVGIDLSSLSLDEGYVSTPQHYFVEASEGGEFAVTAVYPATKIEPNDMRYKGEATHVLVLTGKNIPKGAQEIQIKLRQQIPEWVAESSTMDDCDVKDDNKKRLNKTFGLLPLVEGVKEAFELTPKSAYFSLPIQIKR
jgi:hypothetical protein